MRRQKNNLQRCRCIDQHHEIKKGLFTLLKKEKYPEVADWNLLPVGYN